MKSTPPRPLITFLVLAYNQEELVKYAVESALAQTYHPLEIILSDDNSSDKTFAVMKKAISEYNGAHKVTLRKNSTNLGLVRHIDEIMKIAAGELVVANAGDDISLPNRAERIAKIWSSDRDGISLIHSKVTLINNEGAEVGEYETPADVARHPTAQSIGKEGTFILGASMAWSRKVFTEFGPLGDGLSVEDSIIPFRAALIGRIVQIDERLLKYRIGGISTKLENRGLVHEYMYGISHKIRKWKCENDLYILTRFEGRKYPFKKDVEASCRRRYELIHYQVLLAENPLFKRYLKLHVALRLCLKYRTLFPLKVWIQYSFEFLYVPYAKIKQKLKRKKYLNKKSAHN